MAIAKIYRFRPGSKAPSDLETKVIDLIDLSGFESKGWTLECPSPGPDKPLKPSQPPKRSHSKQSGSKGQEARGKRQEAGGSKPVVGATATEAAVGPPSPAEHEPPPPLDVLLE